jgi:O-antigen ligase
MADVILPAAAVLAIAALSSLRPRPALYIALAILQTQFLFLPVSTFHLSPADVMMAGSAMAFGFRLLRGGTDARESLRAHVWALAVVLGYAFGGWLAGHFSRTIVRIAIGLVPSLLIVELVRERTQVKAATTALVIAAVLDAAFAFWLYANGVSLQPDRFAGIAGPNFSAIVFTVAAAMALARLSQSSPAMVLAIPGPLAALSLATLSKMAAIGLALGGATVFPVLTRRNRLVLATVAGLLAVAALSQPAIRARLEARFQAEQQNDGVSRTSTELRWWMAVTAVRGFAEHPVTGLGYGQYQAYSVTNPEIKGATAGLGFGTHNTYLEVLAEGGLLAFVPFILHLAFARRAVSVYRAAVASKDTVMLAALTGLPVILLCAALTNMLLHYSLWAVLGVAFAASRMQQGAVEAAHAAAAPHRVAS